MGEKAGTMETSIGVTADLHAHLWTAYATVDDDGNQSRLMRVIEALKWAAFDARDRGASAFLILGDVFHTRRFISVSVADHMCAAMTEIQAAIPTIVLKGNHDISDTGDERTSIRILDPIVDAVVTEPRVIEIDGWAIGFIPWTDDPDSVKRTVRRFVKDGCVHHCAHLGVQGGKVGPTSFEIEGHIPLNVVVGGRKRGWTLMGHYHKTQTVKRAAPTVRYVGSPLQHTWSETGEKKGYVLATKRKLKFVPNRFSPRFVEVTPDCVDDCRDTDYVRIVTKSSQEQSRVRDEVKDKFNVSPVVSRSAEEPEGDKDVRIDPSLGREAMLRQYAERAGVPKGVTVDEVVDAGVALLRDVGEE